MKPFFRTFERQRALLDEAMDWKGTPFRARSMVKDAGVDCVHLAAALYLATGVIHEFRPPNYSIDGGYHDEKSKVLEYLMSLPQFVKIWEDPERPVVQFLAGDLLLIHVGKVVHHVGVVFQPPRFVHILRQHVVLESDVRDPVVRSGLVMVYRPMEEGS